MTGEVADLARRRRAPRSRSARPSRARRRPARAPPPSAGALAGADPDTASGAAASSPEPPSPRRRASAAPAGSNPPACASGGCAGSQAPRARDRPSPAPAVTPGAGGTFRVSPRVDLEALPREAVVLPCGGATSRSASASMPTHSRIRCRARSSDLRRASRLSTGGSTPAAAARSSSASASRPSVTSAVSGSMPSAPASFTPPLRSRTSSATFAQLPARSTGRPPSGQDPQLERRRREEHLRHAVGERDLGHAPAERGLGSPAFCCGADGDAGATSARRPARRPNRPSCAAAAAAAAGRADGPARRPRRARPSLTVTKRFARSTRSTSTSKRRHASAGSLSPGTSTCVAQHDVADASGSISGSRCTCSLPSGVRGSRSSRSAARAPAAGPAAGRRRRGGGHGEAVALIREVGLELDGAVAEARLDGADAGRLVLVFGAQVETVELDAVERQRHVLRGLRHAVEQHRRPSRSFAESTITFHGGDASARGLRGRRLGRRRVGGRRTKRRDDHGTPSRRRSTSTSGPSSVTSSICTTRDSSGFHARST